MSNPLQRVKNASIDGRAKNPRYIQNQLKRLHEELIKNESSIREAIREDAGHSSSEIDVEYCLALDSVKKEYLSIDPEKCLKEEYSLAHEQDSPGRREAVGIVYILPTSYTLFYSVIEPLAAAVAAGNCVVLELGKTTSSVNDVLRKTLVAALDADTFAIVDSRPQDGSFLNSCVQVLQSDRVSIEPSAKVLKSSGSARAVAIVDRTADVQEAARAIVKARFGFAGKSPYAPDLVLVNEFITKEFSNAVLQHSTKYLAEQANGNGQAKASRRKDSEKESLSHQVQEEEGYDILISGPKATIVHASNREGFLLKQKVNVPLLLFHTISSLDDGIELANSSSDSLLATYIFAAPLAAKYLAQFINADVSLTNHIPISILVGPSAPISHPASPNKRYSQALFTVPRPSFIQISPESKSLDDIVDIATTKDSAKARKELIEKALKPLPPTGQSPGGQIGFFEQGILTGVTVFILPVVVTAVGLGSWGIWTGIRRLRK